MNKFNQSKSSTSYFTFLMKERWSSASFWIMITISAIIIAITMAVSLIPTNISISQYSFPTATLNYFIGFFFIIYLIISCYSNIAKRISTGEMLLLFRKTLKRKKIISMSIMAVIADCVFFVIINLLLTYIIFTIAFSFKWNEVIQYSYIDRIKGGFNSPAVLVQLHTIILRVFAYFAVSYGIALLFLPFLFFVFVWLSFKKSVVYLFIGGISYVFLITFILTIINVLFVQIFVKDDPNRVETGVTISTVIGLLDIRYWMFAVFSQIFQFNYFQTNAQGSNNGNSLQVAFSIDIMNKTLWQRILFNAYLLFVIIGPCVGLYIYTRRLNKHYLFK